MVFFKSLPEHIRSDNGPEFIATAIRGHAQRAGLELLYIEPGAPWQNGYAESFFSRLRDELLNVEEFMNLAEARWFAQRRLHEHNQERPHSSLGYACAHCRAGDQVHTTSKPPQPIEKSPFGASVLATIAVDKFARHLPLYRQQEHLLSPLRSWLSRPLLSRLVRGTAHALRPLAERVRALILASHVIQADETPVRYLDGTSERALCGYFWGFAGDAAHRYVTYDFQDSRSRDGPGALLASYQG